MIIHRSVETARDALPVSNLPPAVVVGLCTHGLAIVRSLVRKRVPVIAVESNWRQASAATRLGVKLHHEEIHGERLVPLLLELGTALPSRPVLFLTNDRMVRAVNAHVDALGSRFRLPLPRAPLLRELIEKDTLGPLAVRQGLRVPRTVSLTAAAARGEEPSGALDEPAFPCVVKPALPMSSLKAAIARDRSALARIAAAHPDVERFIVQDWIDGDDERVYFAAWYFDRTGRPRGAFTGQKIRQVPPRLGNSSAARGANRPDLEREGLRLFRGLDYTGFASVEFKLDRSGAPWFIEATVGRTDYWLKTLIVNGVDLPAIAYADLAEAGVRASERQRNRAAWIDEDRDLGVLVESWSDRSIPRGRLLAELFEPKRFALFDWRDLRPWAAWLRPLARRLGEGVARRLGLARSMARPMASAAPSGEATRSTRNQ